MGRSRGLTITIDGLIGSGKSSTACGVAARLGYRHLDTGAMYRCVTLAAVRAGIAAEDEAALAELLSSLRIELEPEAAGGRVLLNGENVTTQIREPDITRRVAAFADQPVVRRTLVAEQQKMGEAGGVVAEGRDAGTVVFPDADIKILMTAELEVRADRRHRELLQKGVTVSLEEVMEDIRRRDETDAAREYGARHDPDAVREIDTTALTLEQQVDLIVGWSAVLESTEQDVTSGRKYR